MALLTSVTSAAVFAAAEAAAEPKSGLPQLDATKFAGQLFWLVVTFGLLFVLLTYVVIPRIRHVLATRAAQISGDLGAAANAKGQADDALKAYETALAEARGRARALADETRNAIRAESEKRRAEAEDKMKADLATAEARIAATRSESLASVRGVAADSAAAIVERLSGEAVTANEAATAVDTAMAS